MMGKGKDWPSRKLRELLEEVGMDIGEVEKYAFGEKNPRRLTFIVRNAPYESQKGVLLLLLLYFYQDLTKIKKILGYSKYAYALNREFFRNLLWKYCSEFYEIKPTGETICRFCQKPPEEYYKDPHFRLYQHLALNHFRTLLIGRYDYKGLSTEEAIKRLQSLRRYFAGER